MATGFVKLEPEEEDEPDLLKSGASVVGVKLRFLNYTDRKADVIWMNYQGIGLKFKTLEPQESFSVNTYEGHPWIIRDSFSGDKLHADTQEVYYPQACYNGYSLCRNEVIITLPVYTLKTRAMQVVKSVFSSSSIKSANIPQELVDELLSTWDS